MKYRILVLLLACEVAHATGPLIGVELESEKDNKSGRFNHALEVAPGWEFSDNSIISRVELLFERNEDTSADSAGVTAKENKVFLRIRRDGDFNDQWGYYVRGGVGRSFNNERNFNYAYIEPGLEYKITQRWAWTVAYRELNAIDGAAGQHVGQAMTGPSFDVSKNDELELRYVRSHGDKDLTSWFVEYVHKY